MRSWIIYWMALGLILGCKTRYEKPGVESSQSVGSNQNPSVRIIFLVPGHKLGLTAVPGIEPGSEIANRELVAGGVGAAVVAAAVGWKLRGGAKSGASSPRLPDRPRSAELPRSVGKDTPPRKSVAQATLATADSLTTRAAAHSKISPQSEVLGSAAKADQSEWLSDPRVAISAQSSDEAISVPTSEISDVVVVVPKKIAHAPVLSTPDGIVTLSEFDEVDGVRLLKAGKRFTGTQIGNFVESSSAFRLSLTDKELLGKGAFGEVFSWNGYAVKFDKKGGSSGIESEANELASLKHTGAVPDVLGLVVDDAGRLGLVMEKGEPLDRYFSKTPITDDQVVAALADFRTLKNEVPSWSDIKPANMVVVGAPPRIKFIDIDTKTSPAYGGPPQTAFVKSMIEAKLGRFSFHSKEEQKVRGWLYARQRTPELRRKVIDIEDQFIDDFTKLRKSAKKEYNPELDKFYIKYQEVLNPAGDRKWPGFLGVFEEHPSLKDNPQKADWDNYRKFLETENVETVTDAELKASAQLDMYYGISYSADHFQTEGKFFIPLLDRAFPSGTKAREELDKLLAEAKNR